MSQDLTRIALDRRNSKSYQNLANHTLVDVYLNETKKISSEEVFNNRWIVNLWLNTNRLVNTYYETVCPTGSYQPYASSKLQMKVQSCVGISSELMLIAVDIIEQLEIYFLDKNTQERRKKLTPFISLSMSVF